MNFKKLRNQFKNRDQFENFRDNLAKLKNGLNAVLPSLF
jgi:hypothetical protein